MTDKAITYKQLVKNQKYRNKQQQAECDVMDCHKYATNRFRLILSNGRLSLVIHEYCDEHIQRHILGHGPHAMILEQIDT